MITRSFLSWRSKPVTSNPPSTLINRRKRCVRSLAAAITGIPLLAAVPAFPQVNDVGQRPYLGWSTFSEQTINSGFLTQANIQAQSDALAASGLQQHGFQYINIDSGWMSTFHANGRPIPPAPN